MTHLCFNHPFVPYFVSLLAQPHTTEFACIKTKTHAKMVMIKKNE